MTLHPKTWDLPTSTRLAPYLNWGQVLAELGRDHPEIVVLTADLKHSNRLSDFAQVHPDRFFNFGIAEKNMVSAAAGMAAAGLLPYVATYASFIGLLCAEQIRTDVCYTDLPVRILAHHAGITMGFYGSSHHATEDRAILRSFADLTVLCTVDPNLAEAALKASVSHHGPIYFRLGRGREKPVYEHPPTDFAFGRAITVRDGREAAILTTGLPLGAALEAAGILAVEDGLSVRVVDVHTVKPIDVDAVLKAAATGIVLTVEEHNIIGGLGGAVAEVLAEAGVRCRFRRHGLPDEYALIGPPLALYAHYGLDAAGIARQLRELV
ncbi:MAG: transketolase [Anaerolineales bacterium]|nr:MAG: transketolase [Anaerolineales bacterium]